MRTATAFHRSLPFVVSQALVLVLVFSSLSCSGPGPKGSLAPAQALDSLKFSDEFTALLFAAEPEVMDPVDMVFDENGKAYVAEMRDLPDDPAPGKPARGRIKLLEDTDGDGRADKATVFAGNTMHASGLIPWNGGLIVGVSPDILYFKDTNGDGKADVREVWFTGFFHGNPEAQISNPRLGVDNWIYFSNTGNEGLVKSPKHPNHPPLQVRGGDFRYHPIKGIFEAVSGTAQYGATFDDWGNRFISQNTTHLRHVALPRPYLARAPMLEVGSVTHDPYGDYPRSMYPLTEPQEWRVIRTRMRQQRYDELKTGRTEVLAGSFTGATGATIYSGDAWPKQYYGSLFTGDVSANLVRRDILTPEGVTFSARPPEITAKGHKEFLASTDQWFRPTNFANSPCGNLLVMDMQREFIETPVSIPEELRKKMDFYSGDNLGRIYRIVSRKAQHQRGMKVELGKATSAELVKTLEHANGWHRETAHRLLLERQDKSVLPALKDLAVKSEVPQARLRALYLAEALGGLDTATVEAALQDKQRDIRAHAIALAEAFPQLEKPVMAMAAKDADPRVQFQLAFTLGNLKSPAAKPLLVDMAARHARDRYIRVAVLSSVAGYPGAFFQSLLARGEGATPKEMVGAIGSLIGTRQQPAEIQSFVTGLAKVKEPQAGLAGLARGLRLVNARGLKASPALEASLTRSLDAGAGNEAAWDVARHFEMRTLTERAAKDAINDQLPAPRRALALSALRGADFTRALPVVQKVLASNPAPEVQSAAVLALSSFEHSGVAGALLANWKSYGPEARPKVIGALMAQKDRIPVLLDALEKGQVEMNALETAARNRLLELSDTTLAARAKGILQAAAGPGGGRDKVVASHTDALKLQGSVDHGKQVFEDACAKCHLPRKQGGRVGPDLSGINMKSKEELLSAILNPSAAIEPRFVNYMVTTRDGRMYDGVLASETAGALTLRGGSEEDVTLLRSQIAEIRSSTISLMPEDIEKTLSKQDLADVISFLRGGL